ncbi:CATRA conflict system CASPASE/TPR repeat-associated protein [Solwaraspora sp. WMMB335]|uniref:CATRA conflict system CASPASE/TPR repeat-associated protein n=1 Tax=Solwaraspora sp. WMMB335 TaxID=3404118 RepID=UPI003B93228F
MPETARPAIQSPELVVHLFAPLTGPRAERAFADLEHVWHGCRTVAAMHRPIHQASLPRRWPRLAEVRHEVLGLDDVPIAGQQATAGVHQVVLRRHHDLVVLSAVLAPGLAAGLPDWTGLDRTWSAIARARSTNLLGSVRIYQALTPGGAPAEAPPPIADVLALLPVGAAGPQWSDTAVNSAGITVWEVGPTSDARADRRLVVLAPHEGGSDLSAWTWSAGDPYLPPLARYLLHAATIRYHLRVRIASGDLATQVDLAAGLGRPTGPAPVDAAEPARTAAVAGHLSLADGEFVAATIVRQLRLMVGTVETARTNMRSALGTDATCLLAGDGLFAEDDDLAGWFQSLLADDLAELTGSARYLRTAARLRQASRPEAATGRELTSPSRSTDEDSAVPGPDPRSVFVIHGRDLPFVNAFWDFLRALDLRPREWEDIVGATRTATPFLGAAVRQGFEDVRAAVVLLTPDDVAHLHPELHSPGEPDHETQPGGQARPNVLFEAGMAFALHPERTVLIEVGRLRPFADIGGRNVIKFDGSVTSMHKVAQRLKTAGCAVRDDGTSWLDPNRFAALGVFSRRP